MSIDKLPIGYLRTFILIVEREGVNGAIRPGTMTKTTIYNHINAIESSILGKLFKGGYKKENLTPIGQATYNESVAIIKALDDLVVNILSGEISNGK